jgi:hypothetical protein
VFALDLALLLVMVGEIFGLRVVLLEQVDATPALTRCASISVL